MVLRPERQPEMSDRPGERGFELPRPLHELVERGPGDPLAPEPVGQGAEPERPEGIAAVGLRPVTRTALRLPEEQRVQPRLGAGEIARRRIGEAGDTVPRVQRVLHRRQLEPRLAPEDVGERAAGLALARRNRPGVEPRERPDGDGLILEEAGVEADLLQHRPLAELD